LNVDHAPVAQLDRALPSEGRGQGFESLRARQLFLCKTGLSNKRSTISALFGNNRPVISI
jgi:hypothetical protein